VGHLRGRRTKHRPRLDPDPQQAVQRVRAVEKALLCVGLI
jgi:hypothetical protein